MGRISTYWLVLAVLIMGGCATLPENVNRQVSTAYTDTADTVFGEPARVSVAVCCQ